MQRGREIVRHSRDRDACLGQALKHPSPQGAVMGRLRRSSGLVVTAAPSAPVMPSRVPRGIVGGMHGG
jgi:hypothetical protein